MVTSRRLPKFQGKISPPSFLVLKNLNTIFLRPYQENLLKIELKPKEIDIMMITAMKIVRKKNQMMKLKNKRKQKDLSRPHLISVKKV